jgi:hypothetical protein
LLKALNMRPKTGGYKPLSGLATLAHATPTDARPRGGISGIGAGGSGYLFAGDQTKLYRMTDAGMTDVTRVTGAHLLGEAHRWDFTKDSDFVLACTPNDEMQFYQIGRDTNFSDVTGAPRAVHIAEIHNIIVAGNIYDPQLGPLPNAVRWSGINQPLFWPEPESDEAAAVQSDRQILSGEGGNVNDVVSGADVSAIFQEKAIHRMDYRGGDTVFEINRMEKNIGMLVPHSGMEFGRGVFFIAEDGFRVFDFTKSVPIGKDVISATFLADLDGQYLDRVTVAKDPDDTAIWVSYPGSGNVSGRPNKLIIWDYHLNQFSQGEIENEGLIQDATAAVLSLDSPDDPPDDPDTLGDNPPGDPYSVGATSLDDRGTSLGASAMGAFSTAFEPSTFSGTLLEGTIETGDLELNPGGVAFVNGVRPLVDSREATVRVAGSMRRREDMTFGPERGQQEDGMCPARSEARYHRIRIRLPAGWDEAAGADVFAAKAGGR